MIWLVLAVVVALLGVIVLACLAWCWDEPVRRGGYVTVKFTADSSQAVDALKRAERNVRRLEDRRRRP